MLLIQSKSVPHESKMACRVKLQSKPKVPVKPTHLKCSHNKTSSLPINVLHSACAKKVVNKEMRSLTNGHGIVSKKSTNENQQRKSVQKGESSDRCCDVQSDVPQLAESRREENLGREIGDYVQINFPSVEPGTLIRADDFLGTFEMLPNTGNHASDEDCKRTVRSISDTSLRKSRAAPHNLTPSHHNEIMNELRKNFKSSSLEGLNKTSRTTDDYGYEIPLSLQTPIYFSLDDIHPPCHKGIETTSEQLISSTTKVVRRKKARLARFKRKINSSPDNYNNENVVQSFAQDLAPKNGEYEILDPSADTSDDSMTSARPISSFLSSRLRSFCSDDQTRSHRSSLSNRSSLGSSSAITGSSPEIEEFEDDWSDVEYASDNESHYQQIETPSRRRNEHAYEVIEDFLCSDRCKESRNPRNANRYVDLENSNDIAIKSNLRRKTFHDLKFSDAANCTWNTVSTPGVLKLSEFKNWRSSK